MKFFQHLHTRLLAASIAILAAAVIFVTVANVASFTVSYKRALEDRSITVAENIRSVIYKNLQYFPLDGFAGMTFLLQDVLVNNPGLSYCYIADARGTIIYHNRHDFPAAVRSSTLPDSVPQSHTNSSKTVSTDSHYESIIPIIYEKKYLGTVHVAIEKKVINQKILDMVLQNTVILIMFLGLAIYILYRLVTRQVTRPIEILVDRVTDITKNQLTAEPIAVTSEDELGKLAASFNQMQASLHLYIQELNFRNNALHTINAIADKLYRSFDMSTIAKEAVESISFYTNSPRAGIFELDEKNNQLHLIYSRGFSEETIKVASAIPVEGSLSGIAIRRKDVMSSDDLIHDKNVLPEAAKALSKDGVNTVICIPLLFQDQVLGVINLFFRQHDRGELEDYEREIFLSIGKTIGLAMSNARHVAQIKSEIAVRMMAERELDYRNNALYTINTVADKLYRSFDLPAIAKEAVESISVYTNSPRAALFIINEENKQLHLLYSRGFSASTLKVGSTLPLEESFTGLVVKSKQIVTSDDIINEQSMVPTVKKHLLEDKLTMVIGIPLLFQDRIMGVMNLFFRRDEHGKWEDYEKEIFLSIGKTIGLAMANARHVAQIQSEIAERKRAEEKYRSIFENATEGIFQSTAYGRFLSVNPAFARMFSYGSPEEIINSTKYISKQIYDDQVMRNEFVNLMENKKVITNYEKIFLRRDKSSFHGSLNAHAVCDQQGTFLYFEGTIQDITKRKKAEDQIRKLNEELEQRVIERTKELELANKELESFSYSVSHDLRAPLRSIDGFSQILLEDYAGSLEEEPVRYLKLLRTNAQQMGKLITDMLSFSRMSRQSLNKQSVDPAEIVRQVLFELEDMQKNRQVKIVIGDMQQCQADAAMLKVVYANLLSNALKFTSKKESAIIEIGCYRKDEDVFYVKDNGAGFDMKYVGKVFGVFQRLHRTDEFEGTGCGTAIIQRIINRHDGKVWVEAELNKGATFYFTLGKGGK